MNKFTQSLHVQDKNKQIRRVKSITVDRPCYRKIYPATNDHGELLHELFSILHHFLSLIYMSITQCLLKRDGIRFKVHKLSIMRLHSHLGHDIDDTIHRLIHCGGWSPIMRRSQIRGNPSWID